MSDLIRIGGLWKNKAKSGKAFLAGSLGYSGRVVIFPNDHKRNPTDPDYILYIGSKPDKDENTQGRSVRPWD